MTAEKPFQNALAVVRGAGELASGAAFRLHHAGFQVVMTELEQPTCLCRAASFADAVLLGRKEIDGTLAVHTYSAEEALREAGEGKVAVLKDDGTALPALHPSVYVDAIMAKRNLGTSRAMAPIVIGLGPGFIAGKDVHAVVETKRGHRLGRVLLEGTAEENTGIPEVINGHTLSRLLIAPATGRLEPARGIGDRVLAGEAVAKVGDDPVVAAISGVLRGLLPAGYLVQTGSTVGDVDPSAEPEYCYSLSDRALAVGSGVLAAAVELWPNVPDDSSLPARGRGRRPSRLPEGELLGAQEFALMGLLHQRPAHGYDLAHAFSPEADLGAVCPLGLSQLYADLAKLATLGMVRATVESGPRRDRRSFTLTESGNREFLRWVARPVPDSRYLRVDFLTKLYFARRLGRDVAGGLLEAQRAAISREIDELNQSADVWGFRSEVARAQRAFAVAGMEWLSNLQEEDGALVSTESRSTEHQLL